MLVRRGARGGQDGGPETTEDRRRVRPGGHGTRWDLTRCGGEPHRTRAGSYRAGRLGALRQHPSPAHGSTRSARSRSKIRTNIASLSTTSWKPYSRALVSDETMSNSGVNTKSPKPQEAISL